MGQRRGTWRTAVGLICAGVAIAATLEVAAYAANGKGVLLGTSNSATKTTTLKNSKGTPLALKGKTSAPPLTVDSSKKVAKLNADQLDGLDATALQSRAIQVEVPAVDGNEDGSTPIRYTLPTGIPKGTYLATLQLAMSVPAAEKGTCRLLRTGVPGPLATVDLEPGNSSFSVVSVPVVNPAGTTLECSKSGIGWFWSMNYGLITLQRMDQVTTLSATVE